MIIKNMPEILVYNDYIHNNQMLIKKLGVALNGFDIKTCDAHDILSGVLDSRPGLFVMPGGADRYYCEKLDGAANARIKQYVEDGGSYLGICAGAYYGARSLEWAREEGAASICEDRELAFVQSTAIGPIYNYIEGNRFENSWDGLCTLKYKGQSFKAVYRGGCYFKTTPDCEVLARYADLPDAPAAIVYKEFGKGKVMLSGPHIELNSRDYSQLIYKNCNASYDYCRKLIEEMQPSDVQIDDLWTDIVQSLL